MSFLPFPLGCGQHSVDAAAWHLVFAGARVYRQHPPLPRRSQPLHAQGGARPPNPRGALRCASQGDPKLLCDFFFSFFFFRSGRILQFLEGVIEVIVYRGMDINEQNRGFCFVEFADHTLADAAFKCVVCRAKTKRNEAKNPRHHSFYPAGK